MISHRVDCLLDTKVAVVQRVPVSVRYAVDEILFLGVRGLPATLRLHVLL